MYPIILLIVIRILIGGPLGLPIIPETEDSERVTEESETADGAASETPDTDRSR